MPLIRSSWWHNVLSKAVEQFIWQLIATIIAFLIVFFLYNYSIASRMSQLVQELHVETRRANCSVWTIENNQLSPIDLAKISPNFGTLWVIMDFVAIQSDSFWGLIKFFDLFLCAWEVRCWICELRYKLLIVQPLLKDFHRWSTREDERFEDNEPDMVFRYDEFRDKFKREVKASFLRLDHESSRERMLARLLEKLYVDMRLMNELKYQTERRMSIVIVASIFLDYYIVFVIIYICLLMQQFPWDLIVCVGFCTLYPIVLIINSAVMSHQVSLRT
jgi:hypothetical protein